MQMHFRLIEESDLGGRVVKPGMYEVDHLQPTGGIVIKFKGGFVPFAWEVVMGRLHRGQGLMGPPTGPPVRYELMMNEADWKVVEAIKALPDGPLRQANSNLLWLVERSE